MTRNPIVTDIQKYIEQYVSFDYSGSAFVAALWALHTLMYRQFEATPYLVVTSATKRSGKTRFGMEVMSFLSNNSQKLTGATAATIFRMIRDMYPTLHIDEAERLGSEAATEMREALNAGYRLGTYIPRTDKNSPSGVTQWPLYCPKVFVMIGDAFDTLMDRSIVFRMVRGEPKLRFLYSAAEAEGNALREAARTIIEESSVDIVGEYHKLIGANFLSFLTSDRDQDIWYPLFAICAVLAPERMEELKRAAVDMATDKTAPRRRAVDLLKDGAEDDALDIEFSETLLRDMLTVCNGQDVLYTQDALPRLKELATSPWRRFRGKGLDAIDVGNLLSRFGIAPKAIRTGGKKEGAKVLRGYRKVDLERAVEQLGRVKE